MKVEMVLAQICKNSHIKPAAFNAVKIHGVGGGLHDNMGDTRAVHLCQYPLKIQRFRRCHRVAEDFICIAIIDGSDHPGTKAGLQQNTFD